MKLTRESQSGSLRALGWRELRIVPCAIFRLCRIGLGITSGAGRTIVPLVVVIFYRLAGEVIGNRVVDNETDGFCLSRGQQ